MSKYSIGIDFGSLSGRAILADIENGNEIASSIYSYPHGIMESQLPDGTKLGMDWALQDPQDYLEVIYHTIPQLLRISKVRAEDIIGIGIDFTACTVLPVKSDGTPLCFLEEYKNEPHAYVKLWKHHSAQDQAYELNAIASQRREPFLERYGGKVSLEWEVPKVWELVEEAPHIYDAMDYWIEAADWIVWKLCGSLVKSNCVAGFKGLWNEEEGYPGNNFFKALHHKLECYVEEKLNFPLAYIGERAGGLTAEMAKKIKLNEGTAVAVSIIDAHAAIPAVGINSPGKMLAIMGTSSCHMVLGEKKCIVSGICGVVNNGVIPGYYGYEAGQACVGEYFAWFVDNCIPRAYKDAAKKNNLNIHEYLTEKAGKLKAGENGLLALDWWNGNRSILVDADLSGLIIGMTIHTKPEEIYRALIEATAYGTRKIVETFRDNGVPVDEFYASGGISQKNTLAMQIYADVLKMPIKIAGHINGSALGSAIHGAVAAGKQMGGYDDLSEASTAMGRIKEVAYEPIEYNCTIYEQLYKEYIKLHDYFGKGDNDVMKLLRRMKREIKEK